MTKKVYRSRQDQIIGGVASGIAEYFDIDPVIIRIIFVVAALAEGWGIALYLILWLIIPLRPEGETAIHKQDTTGEPEQGQLFSDGRKSNRQQLIGLVLIILGGLFLTQNFIPWFNVLKLWPILIIGLGALVLKDSL